VLLTRREWQLLWRRQIFQHLIQLTGTWSQYRRCYKHASKSKISAWRMKDFSTCLTRNNSGETIFANRNCTGCGRFEYRLVCTEPGWSAFTVTPTKWQNALLCYHIIVMHCTTYIMIIRRVHHFKTTNNGSLQTEWWPKLFTWSECQQLLGTVLQSSDGLMQWLFHKDSTTHKTILWVLSTSIQRPISQ